ncbi:hypothetical protein GCM10009834_40200 [Streptomonospora arabica]
MLLGAEQAEQRALAGAVGPEQGPVLSGADDDAHVVEELLAGSGDVDTVGCEDGRGRGGHRSRVAAFSGGGGVPAV